MAEREHDVLGDRYSLDQRVAVLETIIREMKASIDKADNRLDEIIRDIKLRLDTLDTKIGSISLKVAAAGGAGAGLGAGLFAVFQAMLTN